MCAKSKPLIDKNFTNPTNLKKRFKYYDIRTQPLQIVNFPWLEEDNQYCRLPQRMLGKVRELLALVAWQPAGGMLRFSSDTQNIALKVKLKDNYVGPKSLRTLMPILSGFDVYTNGRFRENIRPDKNKKTFRVELAFTNRGGIFPEGMKQWDIYFPLHNPIESIEIGVDSHAQIAAPAPFASDKAIVFYGSSITQGFCASRPSNTFPAMIGRALNHEVINLGYGGNAKGDLEVAAAINELNASCFVMDYDHNAPTVEHLAETHEPFFLKIREAQPELPVIFVTSPNYYSNPTKMAARAAVIEETYKRAQARGDKHVYFVQGRDLYSAEAWNDNSFDCLHPNDLGFDKMTQAILPIIQRALS